MVVIRKETSGDESIVHEINLLAFGGGGEAELVDRLRGECRDAISLVAEDRDRLVGHILFTPVAIEGTEHHPAGMGLGPIAVLPAWQRQGFGSRLVKDGLRALRAARHPFVVVLGDPGYYSRFGFAPAARHGLSCEFGAPAEAFMILPLEEFALDGVSGVVRYHAEFDAWK